MMSQKENFFTCYLTEATSWYSGKFVEIYRDVDEGCDGFLNYLRDRNV